MQKGYEAECLTENCPATVFLPEPNPLQSFEVQPYSPTGTWPLLFVCPRCRHGSTLERQRFYPSSRPDRGEQSAYEALWFIIVQCSEDNCPLLLRLHTTADSAYLPDSVDMLILPAIEEFHCEAGHRSVAAERSPIAMIQRANIAF
jgi:hypothetical protein